ncbi:hypothetical protein WDV92_10660 [Pseudomonas syringae pv. atrofaciens]
MLVHMPPCSTSSPIRAERRIHYMPSLTIHAHIFAVTNEFNDQACDLPCFLYQLDALLTAKNLTAERIVLTDVLAFTLHD